MSLKIRIHEVERGKWWKDIGESRGEGMRGKMYDANKKHCKHVWNPQMITFFKSHA